MGWSSWRSRVTAANAAFAGSLVLTLMAFSSNSVLNRDGMLYIRTAQAFIDGGLWAAKATFAWPFVSIVIGGFSSVTGLALESSGYVLNAFFMAGTCALMVSAVGGRQPEVAWPVCLVVSAIPGLNEYRDELLREYGCWFFCMLAFWAALRWSQQPNWPAAILIHGSLAAAALYRPEALALSAAIFGWQIVEAPVAERWRRLAMVGALPALAGLLLVSLYFAGLLAEDNRLVTDLGRVSIARFDAKAQILGSGLIEYAREGAKEILLFGSLALIPIKVVQKAGPFALLLGVLFYFREVRTAIARHSLFVWGIAAHATILAVFVIDLQFLAGRYVGLILLFLAPFAGSGMLLLMERHPRFSLPLVVACIAAMIVNVTSIGGGKEYFVEAGQWLARNANESLRIYIDSERTAYYAGWSQVRLATRKDLRALDDALKGEEYDLLVVEVSRKDLQTKDLVRKSQLQVSQRFGNGRGDTVLVIRPAVVSLRMGDGG